MYFCAQSIHFEQGGRQERVKLFEDQVGLVAEQVDRGTEGDPPDRTSRVAGPVQGCDSHKAIMALAVKLSDRRASARVVVFTVPNLVAMENRVALSPTIAQVLNPS